MPCILKDRYIIFYIVFQLLNLIIVHLFHHTFKPTDILVVIILFQMRHAKGIWPKDNNSPSHLYSALLGFVHHGTTVCPQWNWEFSCVWIPKSHQTYYPALPSSSQLLEYENVKITTIPKPSLTLEVSLVIRCPQILSRIRCHWHKKFELIWKWTMNSLFFTLKTPKHRCNDIKNI